MEFLDLKCNPGMVKGQIQSKTKQQREPELQHQQSRSAQEFRICKWRPGISPAVPGSAGSSHSHPPFPGEKGTVVLSLFTSLLPSPAAQTEAKPESFLPEEFGRGNPAWLGTGGSLSLALAGQ